MPYLNLDPNYFDHPKTRRLVGILGPMSDVLPLRLWAYCARLHKADGAMRGYSDIEIEGVIGWLGTPKEAIRAMTEVGFLLCTKRGYKCVDWLQHQGHLEMFSRRARDCAKRRWGRHATSNATSNARIVPTQCSNKQTNKQVVRQAKRPSTFTPPSLEEVKAYCQERRNKVDPSRFWNFYEAKGWMVGRNKMKDWRAAVRGQWESEAGFNAPEVKAAIVEWSCKFCGSKTNPRSTAWEGDICIECEKKESAV